MNVSLTPQLEKFVNAKVESGRYTSASEVVREALRLLEQHDVDREKKLEDLRREIAIGLEQADRGQTKPFDEAAVERIIARGRAELRKRNAS